VWVSIGVRHRVPSVAVPLTQEAAERTLSHYAEQHPRTWHTLQHAMASALSTPDLRLPMVRLVLTADR
jgi:hypothetical protein